MRRDTDRLDGNWNALSSVEVRNGFCKTQISACCKFALTNSSLLSFDSKESFYIPSTNDDTHFDNQRNEASL